MPSSLHTPIDVRNYGALGDNSHDDTTAIQKAIDVGISTGRRVYIPAGFYKITTLNIPDNIHLYGDFPEFNGVYWFGWSGYTDLATHATGTWLRSTLTSGNAINVGSLSTYTSIKLNDIGVIGPGSGTSIGVKLNQANRSRITNIQTINFATGLYADVTIDATYTDIRSWGCKTGIYVSGGNQCVFLNTDLQWNQNYAIRLVNTFVCTMIGGVTEVNSGTPVMLESASAAVVFENWYFEDIQGDWPSPITNNVFVDTGCDYNVFSNCHFNTQQIMINGNANRVINAQGAPPVVCGGVGNVFIGSLNGGITETWPGYNIIADSVQKRFTFPGRLEIGADPSIPVGPVYVMVGSGSPEGSKTAPVGSIYLNRSGGTSTTLYVKTSGTGNTGWTAK